MPEENEYLEQPRAEINNSELSRAEMQKRRNTANNTKAVKAIANIAENSGEPTAMAIGKGIKTADALTGGKASELIGKGMNLSNKLNPGARVQQAMINKIAESGTADRIGTALNKKKSSSLPTTSANMQSSATKEGKSDNFLSRKEVEEQTSEGGEVVFKLSKKAVIALLVSSVPVMTVVVFCCLFIAASQTFLQVIGLGQADEVSSAEADKAIRDNGSDGLDEEITDDNVDEGSAYNYDFFIEDENSMFTIKLKSKNFIASTRDREYNEADLKELEDYYSDIKNYKGQNYDMNTVYLFFFKLYYIQRHYKTYYGVDLDMPLIMSTLNLQSTDKSDIFISNTKNYKTKPGIDNDNFNFDVDWSNQNLSKDDSEHDIEILAQNMVVRVENSTCQGTKDGACYKIVDKETYKEFLKEFLEKKYFVGGSINGRPSTVTQSQSCSTENPFIKYSLTDDQVRQLASLAYHEQGTPKGAAAEASLMANLFETRGNKFGTGAEGLYNYVKNSGWFANAAKYMASYDASEAVVTAVRSVLVDGKRTLPGYINEHDWINDISSATNDGKSISVNDENLYIQHKTKLKNIYGSTYIFYLYPDTNSDPFGYTSEKMREEKGEFHYDFDTGNPVNCSEPSENSYADAIIELANKELVANKGKNGAKYNAYFNFSANTPWCANFVSYLISNTSVNGVAMYPNIIDFRTASTGTFMNNFYNSSKGNIKFYYNDSCKNLSGKNKDGVYFPKKGDLIFIDWDATFTDISDVNKMLQDHTAIVEKYENGYIHTIEGNLSNRIKTSKYKISDCRVIGYGSWY